MRRFVPVFINSNWLQRVSYSQACLTEAFVWFFFTYIFMIDKLHEFKFSVSSFSMSHILEWSRKLFNSNMLFSNSIKGGTERKTVKKQFKIKQVTRECRVRVKGSNRSRNPVMIQ